MSQLHGKIDSEKQKKATASPEIGDEEIALSGGDIKGGRGGEGSPVRVASREEEESQADNNPGIDLSPVDATKRPTTKKTQIPNNKRVAKESHVSFAEKSDTEEVYPLFQKLCVYMFTLQHLICVCLLLFILSF